MTGFVQIFRNNARTFYNYRTNEVQSRLRHYVTISGTALGLAAIFRAPSNDIYTGFVACQALLVGFSFNLIFYLSANGKLKIPNTDLLEDKAEVGRLNSLGNEIFHNISYFNLVSIFSVILSLILLMFSGFKPIPCIGFHKICESIVKYQNLPGLLIWQTLLFGAYIFTIESTMTFLRMIRRTSAYFEDRATLLDTAQK